MRPLNWCVMLGHTQVMIIDSARQFPQLLINDHPFQCTLKCSHRKNNNENQYIFNFHSWKIKTIFMDQWITLIRISAENNVEWSKWAKIKKKRLYIYMLIIFFALIPKTISALTSFGKTLPKSILQMHLISVRFYEMGDISFLR